MGAGVVLSLRGWLEVITWSSLSKLSNVGVGILLCF